MFGNVDYIGLSLILFLLACSIVLLFFVRSTANGDHPKDALHLVTTKDSPLIVAVSDVAHHAKYAGSANVGSSRLFATATRQGKTNGPYTPSPVQCVQMGAEPLEYLDRFGKDSVWYEEIQAYARQGGEAKQV